MIIAHPNHSRWSTTTPISAFPYPLAWCERRVMSLWGGNCVAGVLRQENMVGLQSPRHFQPVKNVHTNQLNGMESSYRVLWAKPPKDQRQEGNVENVENVGLLLTILKPPGTHSTYRPCSYKSYPTGLAHILSGCLSDKKVHCSCALGWYHTRGRVLWYRSACDSYVNIVPQTSGYTLAIVQENLDASRLESLKSFLYNNCSFLC